MTDITPKNPSHSWVSDPDSDMLIYCPAADDPQATVAFKVAKRKLQLHSPVFDKMVRAALIREICGAETVVLELPEVATTIEVLLAAVCNIPGPFSSQDADQTLTWRRAMDVWEAANKYQMYAVRGYAQVCLRWVSFSHFLSA